MGLKFGANPCPVVLAARWVTIEPGKEWSGRFAAPPHPAGMALAVGGPVQEAVLEKPTKAHEACQRPLRATPLSI
jgi:hypothetical protein